jgi:choloylglycine hydrolase
VKYGSVTFNQLSLELPVSGMNETGLAVALLWHEEGDYGDDNDCSRLSPLQWIQYQLDNFESVAEVIDGLNTIRPEQGPIPLHFTVLDARGNSLLVEFINGELVLHENSDCPILTNNSYLTCLADASQKSASLEQLNNTSIGRFNHLYKQFLDLGNRASPNTGFDLLNSVSQTPGNGETFPWNSDESSNTITAWSIVFDPTNKIIFLKTHQNRAVRNLYLKHFNFEADGDYLVMDIHAGTPGSATPFFTHYSKEKNHHILNLSAPYIDLPEEAVFGMVDTVDYLYRNRSMTDTMA